MRKINLCFVTVVFITILCSCRKMTDEEYKEWKMNQPTYEYENVEAAITDIDMRHWFAGTHRYEWHIEVYYEPYDLRYTEDSWSTGAFNAPSFLYKRKGDEISVEVCNKYIRKELTDRYISEIN